MIPILPREMLWTDLKTMDQFFELDPINETFHAVLVSQNDKPYHVKLDEVKVFNEVYYQITRMMYERPAPRELSKYIADIRGNMGRRYSVELVMSMLYFMVMHFKRGEQSINRFLTMTIAEKFSDSPYWGMFKKCNVILGRRSLSYTFKPQPVSPSELADKYVHWQEITNDYDTSTILEILGLWSEEKDRRTLLDMIKSSINFNTPKLQRTYYNQVNSILKTALFGKVVLPPNITKYEVRINELDSKLLMLQKENAVFQNLTRELQTENEKLKTLNKDVKLDGVGRKFTLLEIVDYCKGRPELKDTEQIVNMVNKLLRHKATDEDWKLLDSIEEEFNNKSKGNTFNNAKVTMQNPLIDSVYRISGNDTVNMGEIGDGEEE